MKDLCPIYLTPCNSKIAEDFVVCDYVKPQALQILDDDQFGAPKSSTTLAQQEMLHTWTEATDGSGSTIKTILFDYRKAFGFTDQSILVSQLRFLDLPVSIINWIIDFFFDRSQKG